MMVSVVLALYNGEKYLADQIRSILTQSHRDLELLLMEDGSRDRSLEIAEEFARQDPRVQIHRNSRNLGIVENFLKGISLAQGAYICLSDQDDVWKENKIEKLKDLLDPSAENMLAYSDLEICDENLNGRGLSFWAAAGVKPREGHLGEIGFLRNLAPGCSMMFRKEVKEALANLYADPSFNRLNSAEILDDTPFMHDHLAFFIASTMGRVVYTREKLVRYRQHTKNSIGAFYLAASGKERLKNVRDRKIEILKSTGISDGKVDIRRLERLSANTVPGRLRRWLYWNILTERA